MPKSKLFPYPLPEGTHVVAKVRRLDLSGDELVAGTIVRVLRRSLDPKSSSVSYAIKTRSGGLVQALASRTTPIDTSTPEGLDQWLDALEDEPDPADLPGVDLQAEANRDGADLLRRVLDRSLLDRNQYPNTYELRTDTITTNPAVWTTTTTTNPWRITGTIS